MGVKDKLASYWKFKGILKFPVDLLRISIEQSVIVSGIVYVFMRSAIHDWSCARQFTNYWGPTGALTTKGCLITFLILLKIG